MKILITAFEPFNNKITNTTMKVVSLIDGVDKVILPVSYSRVTSELLKAYEKYKPDYILSIGEANRSKCVEIERFAHNVMGSSIPDNDGILINNQKISEGKLCLTPNYDVYNTVKHLKLDGFNVIESHTAGSYICNLVMYKILELKDCKKIVDGAFIHIPHLDNEDENVQSIAKCITKFLEYFTKM